MWILITLLCLFLFILLLLSLPFDFIFRFNTQESPVLKMRLLWLFGLVQFDLKQRKKGTERKIKEKREKKKPQEPRDSNNILRIIRIKDIFRKIVEFIKDLFHDIKIKELAADIKVGLEDPVDNGFLFACAVPANYLLKLTPYRINIQPVFENEFILECWVHGKIRVFPIQITCSIFKFIFSIPILSALSKAITGKWAKKRRS